MWKINQDHIVNCQKLLKNNIHFFKVRQAPEKFLAALAVLGAAWQSQEHALGSSY